MLGQRKTAGARGQRHSARRTSLFGGRVVDRDGLHSFDCAIRDISKAGAKIEIDESVALPKTFFLLESRQWIAYEAELAWRKGKLAGVRFLQTYDLARATEPELHKIKYLSASLVEDESR